MLPQPARFDEQGFGNVGERTRAIRSETLRPVVAQQTSAVQPPNHRFGRLSHLLLVFGSVQAVPAAELFGETDRHPALLPGRGNHFHAGALPYFGVDSQQGAVERFVFKKRFPGHPTHALVGLAGNGKAGPKVLKMPRPGVVGQRVEPGFGLRHQTPVHHVAQVKQAHWAGRGPGQDAPAHRVATARNLRHRTINPVPVHFRIAVGGGNDGARVARAGEPPVGFVHQQPPNRADVGFGRRQPDLGYAQRKIRVALPVLKRNFVGAVGAVVGQQQHFVDGRVEGAAVIILLMAKRV